VKALFTALFCAFLFIGYSATAQLRINEVLYDPSDSLLRGDANGDGVYVQGQDEFIEMVNIGQTPLDISKYKIYDRVVATGVRTLRHTIALNTIVQPEGVVVVFGGGAAVGSFGGAIVFVDRGTTGLSMGNTGERVLLADSTGQIIDSLDTDALSNNPNESYTKNPDLTGPYVQHAAAMAGKLFSPGTKVDGSRFAGTLGLFSSISALKLSVYPNPTSGSFTIKADKDVSYKLLDLTGKELATIWSENNKIDLGNVQNGIYLLKENNGIESKVVRLVVNK
jgi:hypothetical protein